MLQPNISENEQRSSKPTIAGVNEITRHKIECLITLGQEQAEQNKSDLARQIFELALKLDEGNMRATLALCQLLEDSHQISDLLRVALRYQPNHTLAQVLLRKAEAQTRPAADIEEIIKNSSFIKSWDERQKDYQERVRFQRDKRNEPIPKLGKLLLEAHYISEEQLNTALNLQDMLTRLGTPQLLGQLLLDYGYISASQLQEVLQVQEAEYRAQLY